MNSLNPIDRTRVDILRLEVRSKGFFNLPEGSKQVILALCDYWEERVFKSDDGKALQAERAAKTLAEATLKKVSEALQRSDHQQKHLSEKLEAAKEALRRNRNITSKALKKLA